MRLSSLEFTTFQEPRLLSANASSPAPAGIQAKILQKVARLGLIFSSGQVRRPLALQCQESSPILQTLKQSHLFDSSQALASDCPSAKQVLHQDPFTARKPSPFSSTTVRLALPTQLGITICLAALGQSLGHISFQLLLLVRIENDARLPQSL